MTTIETTARQGDVLIQRVETLPAKLLTAPRDEHGHVVLALGEGSGHRHALRDKHVTAWRFAGSDDAEVDFIEVGGAGPATLNHEYVSGVMAEHHPITLPPGVYRVVRQREYSPAGLVRVVD